MTDQINRAFAELILDGLADRSADRMAGWVRCVARAYCLGAPTVASVRNTRGRCVGASLLWASEGLEVQILAHGAATWHSALCDNPQQFDWIADGSEYVVGRGLEVVI